MTDAHRIILPSFGAFTGGLDVRSQAIARHFPDGARAFLLGRDRVFCFSVPADGQTATPCDEGVANRGVVATGGRAHRFW